MNEDEMYMRRCLQLAANGLTNAKPNPMVGAVIVHNGRIIGEGYHARYGEGHAEVNAFASVRTEDERLLHDSTLYVSLEPCSHYGKTPPCADLIVRKGVKRVVVGCIDPFAQVHGRGIKKMRDAGIEVDVGVLRVECLRLNRRFVTVNEKHRPYIILKWAQTANGFIDDNFNQMAISSRFTRMLSHKLRSESDAILVGRTTEEREHPQLNVRFWSGKSPKKLVLDHTVDIQKLMGSLAAHGMQSLIVEGGRKTHESFITLDLWDEIRVETSPAVSHGGTRAPLLPTDVEIISNKIYDGVSITRYGRLSPSTNSSKNK